MTPIEQSIIYFLEARPNSSSVEVANYIEETHGFWKRSKTYPTLAEMQRNGKIEAQWTHEKIHIFRIKE